MPTKKAKQMVIFNQNEMQSIKPKPDLMQKRSNYLQNTKSIK